jgi:ABC-type Fe3+-hydroxamate transport system substrate-binding protein
MNSTVTDQLNRSLTIGDLNGGIVSLVPSQTELLFDLGLAHLVTGVTKFCIHPEQALKKCTVVGGTKNLHFEKIRSLSPSLILANKEENNREDIEQLAAEFPVWVSDVNNLSGAIEMITAVGNMTGTHEQAASLSKSIAENFSKLPVFAPVSALYLIWNNPVMAAGNDTFISDMMGRCGLVNCLSTPRYPEVHSGDVAPEVILLSSEPFPFSEQHVPAIREQFPNSKIVLVDGTYFSWYGSRLEAAPDYFVSVRNRLEQETPTQQQVA